MTSNDIAVKVSERTGMNISDFIVGLQYEDGGNTIRVVVYVNNEEEANIISEIIQEEYHCNEANVLQYIPDTFIDKSHHIYCNIFQQIMMMMIIIMICLYH